MPTQSPATYDPRYADTVDIPIEVRDSYGVEAKREALYQAESEIDIDRNGGQPIAADDFTPIHHQAVLNLATHYLVRGATSNDDVTLGDLDDGGEQTERHAEQYRETYEMLCEKLAEAGPDGQSGTYFGAEGDPGTSIAVNAGPDARRHDITTNDSAYDSVAPDDFVSNTN